MEIADITEKWLDECSEIHYLHSHYHKREHIWKYESKFKTIFVHAYPKEMEEVMNKVPELKRLQFNTKVDSYFYNEFLQTFKQRIWIGNNPTKLFDDFPNYTYPIPNFYEFKHNYDLNHKVIDNGKIGFTRQNQESVCIGLDGCSGYILSSKYDYVNLRDTSSYTFPNIKFYQWNPSYLKTFMKKGFWYFSWFLF